MFYEFFIGLLMVELKDQTKRSLSKLAGLACCRQGGCLGTLFALQVFLE